METRRCPDFAAILRESPATGSIRDQVVACFYSEMVRYARRRCPDPGLAEDAAQAAAVTTLESLPSFRGDAPMLAWLRRLVVSACSRLTRGRKNDPAWNRPLEQAAEPAQEAGQEWRVMLAERVEILSEVLAEVPEPNRSLLLLHEGEDVPLAELAERFGLSIDGVKARLKRTRKHVRVRLLARAEEAVSRPG